MKIVPVADVKARFSRYLDECERGPVVVTKNGRAVAVLLYVSDEDELERLVLAHTPKFRRLLEAAERRIRKTGGVNHADFWGGSRSCQKEAKLTESVFPLRNPLMQRLENLTLYLGVTR